MMLGHGHSSFFCVNSGPTFCDLSAKTYFFNIILKFLFHGLDFFEINRYHIDIDIDIDIKIGIII